MSSLSPVNFHNKDSVRGYVQTALYSAGEFLRTHDGKIKLNEDVFKSARASGGISEKFRPTVINLFNIVDNGSVGWFGSKNITLFSNLFSRTPAAPASDVMLSEEEEEKKKKESQDRRNTVLGSVATLAAALLSGFTYAEYSLQKETLSKTEETYTLCSRRQLEGKIDPSLSGLIISQICIDKLNYAKAVNYFYSSIGALIGGSAWALGGFSRLPHLSTAGKIISLVAAAWALFNLGNHWNDNKEIKHHCINIAGNGKEKEGWAAQILQHELPQYSDEMNLIIAPEDPPPPYEPQYQPLYSTLLVVS